MRRVVRISAIISLLGWIEGAGFACFLAWLAWHPDCTSALCTFRWDVVTAPTSIVSVMCLVVALAGAARIAWLAGNRALAISLVLLGVSGIVAERTLYGFDDLQFAVASVLNHSVFDPRFLLAFQVLAHVTVFAAAIVAFAASRPSRPSPFAFLALASLAIATGLQGDFLLREYSYTLAPPAIETVRLLALYLVCWLGALAWVLRLPAHPAEIPRPEADAGAAPQ